MNPSNSPFGGKGAVITRTVWLLSFVSLFNDLASELLYPVMPVYLKSIGFTVVAIGILEGVAEVVAGLTKGYFGQMSDNMGKRMPFVQLGYSLTAIARLMLAMFTQIPAVFGARVTDRIGKGVRTAARDAILSDESPPGKKATVFGFHRSFDTIGATIGPLAALLYLWWKPGDYKGLIWFAFIPVLVAVMFTFIPKEKSFIPPEKKNKGFFSYIGYWKTASSSYKKIVVRMLLFAIVNSSDVFLLLLLKQKGFNDTYMIGFYIFYNLIYALAAYPIGKIADRIGMNRILLFGFILFSFVYVSINFTNNIYFLAALFFVYGIYAACFESTSKAVIANQCKQQETGTALGFYSGFASIGALIASSWTGFIWYQFNSQTAFIITGAVVFVIGCSLIPEIVFGSRRINKHS